MPSLSGLDLARAIDPAEAPAFIFVTAFSRFAPDAFALAAVDYLLKPVEFTRLHEALERARTRLQSRAANSRIAELEGVVAALRGADTVARWSGATASCGWRAGRAGQRPWSCNPAPRRRWLGARRRRSARSWERRAARAARRSSC